MAGSEALIAPNIHSGHAAPLTHPDEFVERNAERGILQRFTRITTLRRCRRRGGWHVAWLKGDQPLDIAVPPRERILQGDYGETCGTCVLQHVLRIDLVI